MRQLLLRQFSLGLCSLLGYAAWAGGNCAAGAEEAWAGAEEDATSETLLPSSPSRSIEWRSPPESGIAPPEGLPPEVSSEMASERLAEPLPGVEQANSADLNSADLFERVFGAPAPGRSRTVLIPWSINQIPQGEMSVTLGLTPEDVRWNGPAFLEALAKAAHPDLLAQLKAIGDQEMFSVNNLATLQVQARFNPRALTLDIQLAPEQRRTNLITSGSRNPDQAAEPTVQPARLSGYLNTRGSLGWTWLPDRRQEPGRQPVALQWDGALNYQGWVLEGQTRFQEGSAMPWQRGDLRLVHDRPDWALRFQAGEITTPITGYQRGRSILGVSATRQFALQPDRLTRPVSSYEFFLESPARVEVFVNGDRTRILNLPAGTQDLRDFSLGAGINDVELRITDPVGRERRLQFFAPVTAQLLAPGIQQFAYSLGVPIVQENNSQGRSRRRYDFDEPLLTASHRWGITPTLTTGVSLQASLQQQLLGFDGVMATRLGNWDWDGAFSLDPEQGLGYGARLGYEYRRANDPQQRSLRLGLEYRSPTFLSVGETQPNNTIPLEASVSYRQRLLQQVDLGLTGRHQWTDDGNAYRLALDVSRPVGLGRQLGLSFSHAQLAGGTTDQQLRVNFRWSMAERRQMLTTSAETDLQGQTTRRLGWNYRDRVNAFSTGFNLSDHGETWDLSHRLSWQGYRATLDLRTDARGDRPSMLDWSGMESQLSFGTALVFADGHWGWSRPVNGSFALVVPQGSLGRFGLEVNPSRLRPGAVIDRWGPAVVGGLSDYRLNRLTLAAPALPLGYSLGQTVHWFRPGYRQGTLIKAGNDATVFLRGTLQWADGNPAGLVVGEVRSLRDPRWQPQALFTNRVGKFALEGFKPGLYQIRLTSGEQGDFVIPEATEGVYGLEPLRLAAPDPGREAVERASHSAAPEPVPELD